MTNAAPMAGCRPPFAPGRACRGEHADVLPRTVDAPAGRMEYHYRCDVCAQSRVEIRAAPTDPEERRCAAAVRARAGESTR